MSDQPEEPSVRVTLSSIYEKLLDMDRKLDPVPGLVNDHASRLRKLEVQVAVQWVAFGIIVAGVGAALIKAFVV